jgi:tetratricopeptide (TPR) repeat protein
MSKTIFLIAFLFSFSTCYSLTAKEYLSRGNAKVEIKNYSGAIDDFSKALEIDIKYTEAYINRGSEKENIEDYSGAIADYSKAMGINPNNKEAY